jgi:hypothetical protein
MAIVSNDQHGGLNQVEVFAIPQIGPRRSATGRSAGSSPAPSRRLRRPGLVVGDGAQRRPRPAAEAAMPF